MVFWISIGMLPSVWLLWDYGMSVIRLNGTELSVITRDQRAKVDLQKVRGVCYRSISGFDTPNYQFLGVRLVEPVPPGLQLLPFQKWCLGQFVGQETMEYCCALDVSKFKEEDLKRILELIREGWPDVEVEGSPKT